MARRTYTFGPQIVPCGEGSRLVIALDDDGLWNVVYYAARFAGDPIGERYAVTKHVLLDAIRVLFAEADEPYDADTVVAYIAGTSWGGRLPRLTARRRPHPMPADESLAAEYGYEKGAP